MRNSRFIDASEVKGNISSIIQSFPQITDALLLNIAKALRSDARRIVPMDTGHLKQSIRYTRNQDGSYTIYAFTRWGSVTRNYAVYVHESLATHHTSGQAKYIERPLLKIAAGPMAEMIAQELLKRMAENTNFKGAWKIVKGMNIDYGEIDQDTA